MATTRTVRQSRQLTARRILECIERAAPIASTTDPTITSAVAGTSTLTGLDITHALVKPTDAVITPIKGPIVPHLGGPYTQDKGLDANDGLIGSGPWGIAFGTDAPAFDVCLNGNVRCRVDGQWTTEYTAPDGQFRYVKFDFGAAARREIELHFAIPTVTGLNVAPGYRIWKTPAKGPRALIFGDSYVQGRWQGTTAADLPGKLGEELGFWLAAAGIAGMGAVKADPDFGKAFSDRANAGEFAQWGTLDLIILPNSLNDYDQAAATVQTNWQAVVARAMADQPDALIYGFSGFQSAGMVVDSAHNAAFVDAFSAVMDSSRMRVDDFSGTQPLVTVSGSDRNDTLYIGGDGIHPSQPAGVSYFSKRIKAGILDFVRDIAYA